MNRGALAKSGVVVGLVALVGAYSGATPFTKIDGTDASALARLDGRWVVINTGGTDVQSMSPPATMTFDTEARTVAGFDGCNDFDGTLTFEDGRLKADVAGTRRACTIGDLFTQGAEVADTSFMGADVLMLTNGSGDVRMAPPEMVSP